MGSTCFEKNEWWAECKMQCTPGIDPNDDPAYQTPWSCNALSDVTTVTTTPATPICAAAGQDCRDTRCCSDMGSTCFEKNEWWAECKMQCTPGIDPNDDPAYQTPWSCTPL